MLKRQEHSPFLQSEASLHIISSPSLFANVYSLFYAGVENIFQLSHPMAASMAQKNITVK